MWRSFLHILGCPRSLERNRCSRMLQGLHAPLGRGVEGEQGLHSGGLGIGDESRDWRPITRLVDQSRDWSTNHLPVHSDGWPRMQECRKIAGGPWNSFSIFSVFRALVILDSGCVAASEDHQTIVRITGFLQSS